MNKKDEIGAWIRAGNYDIASLRRLGCERNMTGSSTLQGFDGSDMIEREKKEVEELLC